MKIRFVILSFCVLLMVFQAYGQQEKRTESKPRIGLVLSGGGAKGFAELGALKVIEEAGLPIDYIAGTSIGSILGAFYAIGYDADSLEKVIKTINWDKLMTDEPERRDIPVFERNEQERYNFTFRIQSGGFKIPTGIMEGQKITKLFADLSLGFHDQDDFSKFPIPFACVGANIATGKEVVLKNGDIVNAIRASMAFPGVFTPVEIDGQLLIDGGVINNFPVDVCRDMGADIIIGIDLQTPLYPKEKINSLQPIMDNMISMLGAKKYEKNVRDCDFYIHPDLEGFSVTDFDALSADSMIQRGMDAARKLLPRLIHFRDSLGIKPVKKAPLSTPGDKDHFYIKDIVVTGLKKYDPEFIFGKLNFQEHENVKLEDIHTGIAKIYGTGNFKKAEYRLSGTEIKTLTIHVKEKVTNTLNVGLHYDDVNSAALLLNATFRGNLRSGTRLSSDLKLSQNPAFAIRFNDDKGWKPGLGAGFFVSDNDIYINNDNDQKIKLNLRFSQWEINLHSLILEELLISGGVRTESYNFHSIINLPEEEEVENNWFFNFFVKTELNNLNHANYPTKGWNVLGEYRRVVHNGINDKKTGPLSVASLELNSAIRLNKRFALLPHFYARTVFESSVIPYYLTFIGGVEQTDYLDFELPFIGARRMEMSNNHAAVFRTDLRGQLFDDHYIFLKTNVGLHSSRLDDIFKGDFIHGFGITYSYDSFIGPMEISYLAKDLSGWGYFFINIGYWF